MQISEPRCKECIHRLDRWAVELKFKVETINISISCKGFFLEVWNIHLIFLWKWPTTPQYTFTWIFSQQNSQLLYQSKLKITKLDCTLSTINHDGGVKKRPPHKFWLEDFFVCGIQKNRWTKIHVSWLWFQVLEVGNYPMKIVVIK